MRDFSLAGHHCISSFGVPAYVYFIPGPCLSYSLSDKGMAIRAVSL